MAVEKIALGINLRKNKISTSSGFGKYYPEVDTQEVTIDGKTKKVQTLKPIATAVAELKAGNGGSTPGGPGSNGGVTPGEAGNGDDEGE